MDERTGTRAIDPFAHPPAALVMDCSTTTPPGEGVEQSMNPDPAVSVIPVVDESLDTPAHDTEREAMGGELVGPVVDGELLSDEENTALLERRLPCAAPVVRRAGGLSWRRTVWAVTTVRAVVAHPRTAGAGKAVGRHLWYPVAGAGVVVRRWGDAHGAGRYERMMRRAETAGDHEALLEWESRDVLEKQRRHGRVMDWVHAPVALVKAGAVAAVGLLGVLLGLGLILALADHDSGRVWAPVTAVIDAVAFVVWFLSVYGVALIVAGTAGCVAYLWHTGRSRADTPDWMAPLDTPTAEGRDVVPDERAITHALRNLNLGPLNKKFKEGWVPRWVLAPCYDGKGWHAQLLLPESVNVPMIVDRKPLLAHNLLRLPVEVWPTEPRDAPGVLDVLVLDPGSMTKPVDPWPLLTQGTTDYFKGVPVGVNPRGRTVIGQLFQANWGAAGTMGSGKSTLIITMLLGAILDPLVEVDVYCMANNADYDPLAPRLRTLFKSDDPDDIPRVLVALKHLMSELSERGRRLSAAGEPKLTRALAAADPCMRPRVVVIDECQELFVSPVGAEAAELVGKIIAKARKYGVTLTFATPVPSADSLPRAVAKVLSNKACFAIGDHQGNDAILGTGKHKAGITAVGLHPLSRDPETGKVDPGDIGTAMTVGFMPQDSLMRCYRVIREEGVDQVTPVVQRALRLREDTQNTPRPSPEASDQGPDLLVDVAEVMRRAGQELMVTKKVVHGLVALNPDAYAGWGPAQLRTELPEAARPYKTAGLMQVSARRLTEALAERDLYPDTDDGPDDGDTAPPNEHAE